MSEYTASTVTLIRLQHTALNMLIV